MTRRVRGLFITGTDTGVGKTLVACALAAWCRQQGLRVGVMKPVATGDREDAKQLARAAGSREPVSRLNPVFYREPLAPWTAARRAGRPIRLDGVARVFREMAGQYEVMIVEGVGGLLVPLTESLTVADFARRLRLPLVVVARAGLGTINHTLLTCGWARRQRLSVRGVVLNHAVRPSADPMARLAVRTNPAILQRLTHLPVLGPLPYRRASAHDRPEQLAGWVQAVLGKQALERLVWRGESVC